MADGPDVPVGGRGGTSTRSGSSRRRRRRRRRQQVRRRRLVWGLVVVLVPLLLGAALLVRDALSLQDRLQLAQGQLEDGRDALLAGDLESAASSLRQGRNELAVASATTNRLLWRGAERVPVVGGPFEAVGAVVNAIDVTARVATAAVERGDVLLDENGERRIQAVNGQVPLTPLRDVADGLTSIDLSPLRRAGARLAAAELRLAPSQVRDAHRLATEAVADTLDGVERAGALLDVLPGYLGADEPRRYFLGMQNPAELRGTGGFLGFFSILTVDGGRFELSTPQVYSVLSEDSDVPAIALAASRDDPPPDFTRRYGQANAADFLANANLDPDLPTVAPIVMDLYERTAGGGELDGVILVDPVALQGVLAVIGPVLVPFDVADTTGVIPNPLPPERFAEVTTVTAYEVFGGQSEARKDYLRSLAGAGFERIFSSDWDGVQVGRALGDAAAGGHIQLFSTQEDEQQAFARVDVAGAFTMPEGHDLLAVTANNTGGNKMDVHVGHAIDARVELVGDDPDRMRRITDVAITVDNPLPTFGRDPYIIGAWGVGGAGGPFAGPPGLNRTWFTVWGPDDAVLRSATFGDGAPARTTTLPIHGLRAVDVQLETPSKSTASTSVQLSSGAVVTREGGDLVWRLLVAHQPKAIPDRLSVEVVVPRGFVVRDASLDGGGDGSGTGVYGEPGPKVTTTPPSGRSVVFTGDASRDVVFEVRFGRG